MEHPGFVIGDVVNPRRDTKMIVDGPVEPRIKGEKFGGEAEAIEQQLRAQEKSGG